MKVSIAVPSFNYINYLPACLDSLARQTHVDIEVLVADGGSNDGSVDIIERYCNRDERFLFVSRQDHGQADAINRAFAHATGDVLCFLNADDLYIRDDAIARVVDIFCAEPNLDLISFGGVYVDAAGEIIRPVRLRYHPMDGMVWMKYRTAVLQPGTFWRANVWRKHPFDIRFHYVFDVEFFWYAFQKYLWNEYSLPIAGYRLHGNNKSMMVRADRIRELADFERVKFGPLSFRAYYLDVIAFFVGKSGFNVRRAIRFFVNSLSYATFYRLPGI